MSFVADYNLVPRADSSTGGEPGTTSQPPLPSAPSVAPTSDTGVTGPVSNTNNLPSFTGTSEASSTSTTSATYTTPVITVPANGNNPYIVRETKVSGTVFIAVGATVGAIILFFISFHFIKSIKAARTAKQGRSDFHEKYHALGADKSGFGSSGNPSTLLNQATEYQPLIGKLPLLAHHPSMGGAGAQFSDNSSTIYNQSDAGHSTSKHDLTKLFISPTAEVMGHKRAKSSTVSLIGGSSVNLANPSPATNRYSQAIPSVYMNSESNYSESEMSGIGSPQRRADQARQGKKTIPSMYLEDLIDQ